MIAIADAKLAISDSQKGDNGWNAKEICETIVELTGASAQDAWAVAYSIVENAKAINIFDPSYGKTGRYVPGKNGQELNLSHVNVSDLQLYAALAKSVAASDGKSGALTASDISVFANGIHKKKDKNGAVQDSASFDNIKGFGDIAKIKGTDLYPNDGIPGKVAGGADMGRTDPNFTLSEAYNKIKNYFSPQNMQMLQQFANSLMSYMFSPQPQTVSPVTATPTVAAPATPAPARPTATPTAAAPVTPAPARPMATQTAAAPVTPPAAAPSEDPFLLKTTKASSLPLGAVSKPFVSIPPESAVN